MVLNSETKSLEFDYSKTGRLAEALEGGRWQGFSLPPHKVVKGVVKCREAGHFSTLRN